MNRAEQRYLELIRKVIYSGTRMKDRTGTGVRMTYGFQLKFDLTNQQLPLLTTKKMAFKSIVEELLWFLRGSTNSKELEDKNVNIWKGNSSRTFLDKQGLFDYPEGELGPIYGFQWRHFGASYPRITMSQGFDQIKWIIEQLKRKQETRQLILTAWNPNDLQKVALPPCHVMCHFQQVQNNLKCCVFQRSVDLGLGAPFNIASYGLLTHIMAKYSGLEASELVYTGANAHIYENHVGPLIGQIKRIPFGFPRIQFHFNPKTIDDPKHLTFRDFSLLNYQFYPKIEIPMAV